MPTREMRKPSRTLWSDRTRALAESVLAFVVILASLAMFTLPLWVFVLLWFATCLLWPSKPLLWKRT